MSETVEDPKPDTNDDPAPPDPPADPPAEDPKPTGDDGAGSDPTPESTGDLTPDATAAELARARKEAANYRAKLRKHEEAEEARKREQMSELEKAQADAAAAKEAAEKAEQARREALAEAALLNAAQEAKFADPTDAVALVASQVEYDESGRPANAADLVKGLIEAKPHLVQSAPGGSPGNPHRPGGSGRVLSDEEQYRNLVNPSANRDWTRKG